MARYIRFFVLLGCLYGLALPFGCEPTVRVCTTNNDCLYGETCLDRLCTTAGESTTESSREMSPEPVAEWAKEPAKEPSGEPLVKDAGQGPVTPDMPREMAPEPSKAGCGSGPACAEGMVCDRQKGICVARICSPCTRGQTSCVGGGVCLTTNATPPESFCGRDCTTNKTCPPGFRCFSINSGQAFQCVPTSVTCKGARVGIGAVCKGLDAPECPAHFPMCSVVDGKTEGVCTQRCQQVSDCPLSYKRCADRGDGTKVCLPGCATDDDCPTEQPLCQEQQGVKTCVERPYTGPEVCGQRANDKGIGKPCPNGVSDCGSGGVCIGQNMAPVTPFCTQGCQADSDCGTGAVCRSVQVNGAANKLCLPMDCLCLEAPVTNGKSDLLGVALKEVGRTRCSLLYKRSELNLISKDVAFDPFRLSFFNRVHREPLQFLAWSQRYQASLANILKASDLSAIPGAIVDAAARLDAPVDTTLSTSFSPAAQEPLANAVAHLTKELGGTPDLTALKKDAADVPLALQKQVAQIVLAMTAAAKLRNEALGPVGRANARYYFDRIPFVVLPGFQRLSFGSPAAPSRDYEYLRKGFQAAKMYEGAWLLASAIATSGLQANASYKGFSFNQFTPIGRIIISDNADQVYSIQKAEYRGEIALVVDTGGNDTYEIAAGANSNHLNSVAVVIDLGGADTYGYEVNAHSADGTHRFPSDSGGRYSAPGFCQKDADCQNGGLCVHSACQKPCKVDADCANQGGTCRTEGYCKTLATAQGPFSLSNAARQGAGRLGIGMLIDLGGGKDEYRSLRMSQGFGALGVGILYDDGGDDLYQCEAGCQGSGVFGVGLLLERAGNDTYRTFTFAQGFGYVRGVGMLLDQAGDDRYLADHGNPKVDMYPGQKGDPLYLSAQLAGRANSSFVQGAGFGRRADFSDKMFMSGGIGVLYDQAGKDRYVAGVFGQGTGFWYGTGLLFDRDGDDLYDGFWYVQGATAHFALSALLEGAGHDKYNTILTPVATHTGVGHDFSTSFLVDDNGDDVYNTAGLTLGAGNENGYGFLIDNNGDDAYTSKNTNSMGRANSPNPDDNARNTSGVFSFGLFLDAAGTDIYKQGTGQSVVGNDKTWTQGRSAVTSPRRKLEHGVGIDGTGSSTLSAK